MFGITFLCFVIMQMVPGGPVEQMMQKLKGSLESTGGGEATSGSFSSSGSGSEGVLGAEERELLKKHFGFDKPLFVRYFVWLKQIAVLDLGDSYSYYQPVKTLIFSRFPVSITFGLISFFLTYLVCIPLGIAKAIFKNHFLDHFSNFLIFVAYTIPGFVLGVFLLVFLGGGSFLNLFPLGGIASDYASELSPIGRFFDYVHHMFLPILCYVVGNFAFLTILMKNSLITEMNKDYIKTALVKGLNYKEAILFHAFKNSLIPIVTGIGNVLLILFAGSILIENVFNINGIGRLSYEAIVNRDYPLVMGLILIQSFLALMGRMLSDFVYVWVDPRIHF